jgi:hypothetical protein
MSEGSFPAIIPIIQHQATDIRWLSFSPVAFRPELNNLKRGISLAVFGLSLAVEDVLVSGIRWLSIVHNFLFGLHVHSFQASGTRNPDEPECGKIQSTRIFHQFKGGS